MARSAHAEGRPQAVPVDVDRPAGLGPADGLRDRDPRGADVRPVADRPRDDRLTWDRVTAHADVVEGIPALRTLTVAYMTESRLWAHAPMRASLIDTADRLARIADIAVDRVLADPGFADVVDAFVFAGRLQLDHVQSTRRFAYGEAPTIIPRRGGRTEQMFYPATTPADT